MNERTGQVTDAGSFESLLREMNITDEEIARRKEWLQFTDEDVDRVRSINGFARHVQDEVIGLLYDHFLAFPETRRFFSDPELLERVKALQKQYFIRLTEGDYDRKYVEERLKIGETHARIGLDAKWYLGAYNFHIRALATRLFEEHSDDPQAALDVLLSLVKLEFLDIGLAIDTYIAQRERIIRLQQEAIRELSTPVLQVRERLLIMPIIGVIDPTRARQLTEQLLHSIRDTRARVVVMDITGVLTVDSRIANHLIQTVDASRLMGAVVIVSGLSAEVAQTLVRIGVDLSKIMTVGDLQSGIDEADRILGYRVVKNTEPDGEIPAA
jgi:rsbT co-antagonist protein RsbR